jgi:hydrogenase-4 membrane subunit HyfE
MDHKLRKVVYMSLAGLLLAVLLFMFGITISHNSLFVDGVYYVLTLALLIITLIMLKNNRKVYKKALLSYLMGIDIFFIVLTTLYMGINHF